MALIKDFLCWSACRGRLRQGRKEYTIQGQLEGRSLATFVARKTSVGFSKDPALAGSKRIAFAFGDQRGPCRMMLFGSDFVRDYECGRRGRLPRQKGAALPPL